MSAFIILVAQLQASMETHPSKPIFGVGHVCLQGSLSVGAILHTKMLLLSVSFKTDSAPIPIAVEIYSNGMVRFPLESYTGASTDFLLQQLDRWKKQCEQLAGILKMDHGITTCTTKDFSLARMSKRSRYLFRTAYWDPLHSTNALVLTQS